MDESGGTGPRPRQVEVAGLSPMRAFIVVCALATVVGGMIFATRDASPSEPPSGPPRSPDYTLTDAEAIAEFERLHDSVITAYRERDVSLIKTFALPETRFARTVEDEIRTLVRDRVLDRTRIQSLSRSVTRNTPTLVELEQVVFERPRFVDARSGRDVTVNASPMEQTVVWTMELAGGQWLLSGATITASEVGEA